MLAAKNGHKDVVLILACKGTNLNLVDRVSVYVCTTSPVKIKIKWKYFLENKVVNNATDSVSFIIITLNLTHLNEAILLNIFLSNF